MYAGYGIRLVDNCSADGFLLSISRHPWITLEGLLKEAWSTIYMYSSRLVHEVFPPADVIYNKLSV